MFKMKFLVALCLVAVAAAAPPRDVVGVLKYDNNNIGVGDYRVVLEQSDGSKQEQIGELKQVSGFGPSLGVRGSYSWNAPDGFKYIVKYVADEKGYRSNLEKVAPGYVVVKN